jgi:pimeloyl-ACP methyl ester carboxylesterase
MQTHDGLHLNVTTYGPDDAQLTVFLAHCWTLNQEDWHYQVRDLQREFGHGIRIVTWDHRGHGDSDPVSRAGATIANLALDWSDLIDDLAPTGPLVLAGHSIGGMTLMQLCQIRPDLFERVVGAAFVSTSSGQLDTVTLGLPEAGPLLRAQIPRMLALRSRTLSRRARRRAPIVERLVMRRFVFGRPLRLADAALAVDGLINSPGHTVVGFYQDAMLHDRAHALNVLDDIATHVLVGTRDVLTPPSHARRIADHVRGSVLTLAPDAGHMLPLERDELVSGVLIRLIRPHVTTPRSTDRAWHSLRSRFRGDPG